MKFSKLTISNLAVAIAATSTLSTGLWAATFDAAATGIGVVAQAQLPQAKGFKNCTALNKVYRHGVGKPGAKDRSSSRKKVTNYKKSAALYTANKHLDRDKDGIACEKA